MSEWLDEWVEIEPRCNDHMPFHPREEITSRCVLHLLGRWETLLSRSWQCTCLSMYPTSMWQLPGAGPLWNTTPRWSFPSSTTLFSGEQVYPSTSYLVLLPYAPARVKEKNKWWFLTVAAFLVLLSYIQSKDSCLKSGKCIDLWFLRKNDVPLCGCWRTCKDEEFSPDS